MEEKEITVDLDFKASPDFACSLTTNVLNYLLHLRGQIPVCFDVFEKFVRTIQNENISNKTASLKRQKSMTAAKDTYGKIRDIKNLIYNEYTATTSICIVFGKSIHTALEAYEIHVPYKLDKNTSPAFINEATTLRRVLLQLIQNEHLLQQSHQLPMTNIYVLFNRPIPVDHDDFIELRNFKLNKSCKRFSIKFKDTRTDFQVFEDNFGEVSIKDEETDFCKDVTNECYWYQSKNFIKGLSNEILLNDKSIWQ